jgi:hypothetical protein
MLEAAQWALSSAAAASLAQMAARRPRARGARLVRERQDLTGEWQSKDKALTAGRSNPPGRRVNRKRFSRHASSPSTTGSPR